jgi:hypothetical protein
MRAKIRPRNDPGSDWSHVRVRDISTRGFYFFSPARREIGPCLRFVVSFEPGIVDTEGPLIGGEAKIVRCDDLRPSGTFEAFGIAARITEKTIAE